MRIRTATAAVGIALAGAAFATTAGAGSAAAVTPISDPANGLYFGLEFDRAETAAISQSAIPGLLTQFLPTATTGFILDPDSDLRVVDGRLYSTPGAVIKEMGARQGEFGIALVDPAMLRGYQVLIVQSLD